MLIKWYDCETVSYCKNKYNCEKNYWYNYKYKYNLELSKNDILVTSVLISESISEKCERKKLKQISKF